MTTTTRQHTCLVPLRSYHLLMVQLAGTNERIVMRNYEAGEILVGNFVHMGTGKAIRPARFRFNRPTTLYFVRSNKENLADRHYVAQWSERLQRFCCSCYEGKHMGTCGHIVELDEMVSLSV